MVCKSGHVVMAILRLNSYGHMNMALYLSLYSYGDKVHSEGYEEVGQSGVYCSCICLGLYSYGYIVMAM